MIDIRNQLNRPPISEPIKDSIRTMFSEVPEGKTSALIGIYDFDTGYTRLHFAWKVNDTWKVGAQVGWAQHSNPTGYVGVEAFW